MVVEVGAGIEVTISQEVEVTPQTITARVAVAVAPQPPHKTPPQLSTKWRESVLVAWNPGTLVPMQGSHHTCSRAGIRRRCDRPE